MSPALRPAFPVLHRAFRSRPLVFFLAAWVLGILAADWWAWTPVIAGAAGMGLAGICLLVRHRWAALTILLLGVMLLGLAATRFSCQPPRGDISGWAGQRVTVVGIMDEAPRHRCEYWRVVVRVRSVTHAGQIASARGRLLVTTTEDLSHGEPGDWLRLAGIPARPTPARNPGGFSRELWLTRQRIFATLSVEPGKVVPVPGRGWSLTRYAARVRHWIAETNRKAMQDARAAALVNSLLFGDLDQDAAQQWSETEEQFRRAGLSHVLVVSGTQVALTFGLLYVWRGWALRRHPLLPRVIARQVRRMGGFSQRAALFAGLGLLLPYLLLTGTESPILRAAVMAAVFFAARCLDRETDPENSLAAAALLLLVLNPLSLYDIGGQLSFAAVWGIMRLGAPVARLLGMGERPQTEGDSDGDPRWGFAASPLTALVTVSLAAQLATTPLIAQHFQQVSLIGLFTNPPVCLLAMVLLPVGLVTSLLSTLLIEGGAPLTLAMAVSAPARGTAWLINSMVELWARWEWASVPVFPPGWGTIAVYAVLLFLAPVALSRWSRRRSLLLFAAALAVLAVGLEMPARPVRVSTLTFVDVGQGDCCLLRLPDGTTMLVDGGGSPRAPCRQGDCESAAEGALASALRTDCLDVGRDILASFLRQERVRRIDLLVLSHPHDDHLWGLNSLLAPGERFRIGAVLDTGLPSRDLAYREWEALLRDRRLTRITARRGTRLRLGSARLAVLHPPARPMAGTGSDVNNNSLVLRLEVAGTRVLLPGDAEAPAEAVLGRQDVSADVLKVGHHGSATSTSEAWLDRVRPGIAVISCGAYNRFGHPSGAVLTALEQRGIPTFRTDQHGAVTLELESGKWTARPMLAPTSATTGRYPE
jgi:competence protein ComEC